MVWDIQRSLEAIFGLLVAGLAAWLKALARRVERLEDSRASRVEVEAMEDRITEKLDERHAENKENFADIKDMLKSMEAKSSDSRRAVYQKIEDLNLKLARKGLDQ